MEGRWKEGVGGGGGERPKWIGRRAPEKDGRESVAPGGRKGRRRKVDWERRRGEVGGGRGATPHPTSNSPCPAYNAFLNWSVLEDVWRVTCPVVA